MSKNTQFQKGNSGRPLGAKNKAKYLSDALAKLGIENPAQLSVMVFHEAMKAKDFATAGKMATEFLRLTYSLPTATEDVSEVFENTAPLTTEELRAQIDERGLSGIIKLDD